MKREPDNSKNKKNKKPDAKREPDKLTPDDPKPAKPSLREWFNNAVKSLRALTFRDLSGTAADTLKDLRQPKEIGILIVAIIVPGGMFGWGAYRIHKFRHKAAGNDNTPRPKPDAPDHKPAQDKKPPQPPKI